MLIDEQKFARLAVAVAVAQGELVKRPQVYALRYRGQAARCASCILSPRALAMSRVAVQIVSWDDSWIDAKDASHAQANHD